MGNILIENGKAIGVIGSQGGSGGGHTIQNADGIDLTQRPTIWFKDANITDDSTNNSTNVEVIQYVTQEQWDALSTTADGIYEVGDQESFVLTADQVGYGNGTVEDALSATANNFSPQNFTTNVGNSHYTRVGNLLLICIVGTINTSIPAVGTITLVSNFSSTFGCKIQKRAHTIVWSSTGTIRLDANNNALALSSNTSVASGTFIYGQILVPVQDN